MNAPDLVAVPPGVITETSLEPIVPAGVVAVMEVPATFTTTLVAAFPPTVTLVAPVKIVPAMVMVVPPPVGPVEGVTEAMFGVPM